MIMIDRNIIANDYEQRNSSFNRDKMNNLSEFTDVKNKILHDNMNDTHIHQP